MGVQKYNLFLDDSRIPSDVLVYMPRCQYYVDREWVIVRNYDEFVNTILEKGIPQAISFDHDLADEHYRKQSNIEYGMFTEKTGYHCAQWLIYYCIDNNKEIPTAVFIHSMNTAGSKNIESLFTTYEKIYRRT
jgi:hypothetical protein